MSLILSGTNGLSDVDGSAATPAIRGTDTNTGIFFPAADTVGISTGGTERARVDSSGNLGLGVTPSAWSTFKGLQFVGGSLMSFSNAYADLFQNTYFDGSNLRYVNTGFASYYRQTSGVHSWSTAASGSAGGVATFTQAMTLDANGNRQLGGTTSRNVAGYHFDSLLGSSGAYTDYYVGTTLTGNIGAEVGSFNISASNSVPLVFYTGGSERARIASGGQFCVNTTNTNGAFNVSGNVYLFSQTSGAGNSTLKWNSGTGQVTYDTSSRLVKDNIVDSPYGLAEVLQLKSRKYFRTDDQREEIGLVADEVQDVLPEFVPMSPKSIFTGNEEDTELVPSGVYYEKLSSVLIKAIQEQQALIAQLQADVAALKGNA